MRLGVLGFGDFLLELANFGLEKRPNTTLIQFAFGEQALPSHNEERPAWPFHRRVSVGSGLLGHLIAGQRRKDRCTAQLLVKVG